MINDLWYVSILLRHYIVFNEHPLGKGYTHWLWSRPMLERATPLCWVKAAKRCICFLLEKIKEELKRIIKKKKSLILSLKEIKKKQTKGLMVYSWELWKARVDKQKRENEPHAHTRSHVDNYSFKVKIRMNIGLTYFWKCFSWIGVEIVCMLISQLLLLYMWEAFTHTHIFCLCAWFISNVRIFLRD